MTTALHITTHLKNLLSKGKISDDNELSDFQLLFIVNYYRAVLIRQQQRVGQSINPYLIQTLDIKVKSSKCEKNVVSEDFIPQAIELHNSEMITSVSEDNIQRTTSTSSQWIGWSKFTGKEPRWFIKGRKLNLINYSGGNIIPVSGVWENPYEVELLKGTINEMSPLDFTYPISSTMLDQLYKLVLSTEVKALMLPSDNLNNSIDESRQ